MGPDPDGLSCTPAALDKAWAILCIVSISLALLRLSVDLVQTASKKTSKHYKEDGAGGSGPAAKKKGKPGGGNSSSHSNYGSIGPTGLNDQKDKGGEAAEEKATLLSSMGGDEESQRPPLNPESNSQLATWSFRLQCILLVILLAAPFLTGGRSCVLSVGLIRSCALLLALGAIVTYRDAERERFGFFSRTLLLSAGLALAVPVVVACIRRWGDTVFCDVVTATAMAIYSLLVLGEAFFIPRWRPPAGDPVGGDSSVRAPGTLSTAALATLLKPYVWPDATSESAVMNRFRAVMTWVCVIAAKVANIYSPLLLGKASTALAHQQYQLCIYLSSAYAALKFFGALFREGQSLIYLRVSQAAFVQLSEVTFVHLHRLSLDWHLRKKLGEVMRTMDRGIAACDSLMKWLFLWLVPAVVECLVVCIVFAKYYSYAPLSIVILYSVWIYVVWTIIVTLHRKKYRKAAVKSDNEWHDRATDSLVNFETVKYFTAENYERQRFGESIAKYQAGTVNVQASMSFLNITQQLILQICLALALSLSAMGIKQRIDCCVAQGCDSGVSECCQAIDGSTCPGMEVGDFVAVLTYTLQLFQPLNFLGSVYNAIVMAIVDLTNLSQLLAQSPDVKDTPGAMILPQSNEDDRTIAVEFDNVHFHYPTQPKSNGLKGVSFKMKRGTTTAIVGPTGAGKTTISRLFFRFYDVLGGAVKVNGKDVRTVTQQSLRESIGVVPQSASMFNDTIRENVRYGRRDADQKDLDQAAQDAQLLKFIEGMDEGWDTVVGDRGLKLSGGEKQRAAIARCLLKDPPFVLLDEATSALDTITESSVQEALDRLGSHRTVLVIAHRLGTIRNADNIIVLQNGIVAEQGTHDMLLEKDGLYASMWNKQLHSNSNSSSRVSLFQQDDEGISSKG